MNKALRLLGAALAILVFHRPGALRAQPPAADDQGLAGALFREGRELLEQGNLAAACPKFAESHRLDPALGTLLNLAFCHQRQGRFAIAWAEFQAAAAEAQRGEHKQRLDYAREHAKQIEPMLAHVIINVSADLDGLEVKLDRTSISREAWGSSWPVDPGEHTLRVSAPRHQEWSTTFHSAGSGANAEILIPALVKVPEPLLPLSALPAPPPRPAPTPGPSDRHAAGAPLTTFGVLLGAASIVGFGISAGYGLQAQSLKKERAAHCNEANTCDPIGLLRDDEARGAARLSTLAFASGAALGVTGITLFVIAPRTERAPRIKLHPGLGGISLRGAF
jgi:tetratricopeptide (TPR) repeat protein